MRRAGADHADLASSERKGNLQHASTIRLTHQSQAQFVNNRASLYAEWDGSFQTKHALYLVGGHVVLGRILGAVALIPFERERRRALPGAGADLRPLPHFELLTPVFPRAPD